MKRLFPLLLVLGQSIVFSLHAADQRMNDDTGTTVQKNPAMAANLQGFLVLCWEDYRDGSPRIYGQIVSPKGQRIRTNLLLTPTTAGKKVRPRVAVSERGEFALVWEDSSTTGNDVYVRWFAANGVALTSAIKVNSVTGAGRMNPAVAVDYNENTIVCWQDSREGAATEVYLQRFDYLYRASGSNLRINSEARGAQQAPAVATGYNNEFIVVWEDGRDYTPPTGTYAIYAQRYSAQGTPIEGNVLVSHHAAGAPMASRPSVALQFNGDYMVSWQYGAMPSVYARFVSATNHALDKEFRVPDATAGDPIEVAQMSCISPRLSNGYVIAFAAQSTSLINIYTRSFDHAGNPEGAHVRRSETASSKNATCLAIGMEGIHTLAWADMRNGHSDIYGNWYGARVPLNVTAGSGFNGRVPLTWDPPYGREDITKYTISRATSNSGPFVQVAAVDLTLRGSHGAIMRDWLDTAVSNGATYYYKVAADAAGTDGPSRIVSAIPNAEGQRLNSLWAVTEPTIDGVINPMEWYDARKIDIVTSRSKVAIELLVKNNQNTLYIAVDDTVDTFIDGNNQLDIVYDFNNNEAWPATLPGNEGAIIVNSVGGWFTGYAGEYPNHLTFATPVALPTLPAKISVASGHVQYELAIPVANAAGRTMGFAIWINDPGHFYPYHYGYAAEWPFGFLWESAKALGKLHLALPTTVVSGFVVTNTKDSGAGSLRQALKEADEHAGVDSVLFRIPLSDPGYDAATGTWTIRPTSNPLNLFYTGTIVYGASQSRFIGYDVNPNGPEIVIDGTAIPDSWAVGLLGNENTLQGLVLNNFTSTLLKLDGDGNKIMGCYLGTDASGMQRKGNTRTAIICSSASYNIIGGLDPSQRNIIAGLRSIAIQLENASRYNQILGNYIGLKRTGDDTLKGGIGVMILSHCSGNIIGPGNVLSGHVTEGVALHGRGCDSTRIIGNRIGTSADGRMALGNSTGVAVYDSAAFAFIGGAQVGDRNLISGNRKGILLGSIWSTFCTVQGNHIGVGPAGDTPLPNSDYGVFITSAINIIGGLEPGQGNVVSANGRAGFYMGQGAVDNKVAGNFIGTDSSGTVALPNGTLGVFMGYGANHNLIGPGNHIAFNGECGVRVMEPATAFNTITQNRIYQNGYIGIELQAGNQRLAAPTITGMSPVSGTAPPNSVVEIFSTQDDEGDIFEASVTADADGRFVWNGMPAGPVVTATATDAAGNTSEFSRGVTTRVRQETTQAPVEYALLQNHPNPFNPSTTIRFGVREAGRVRIELFDLIGRSVAVLLDQTCESGWHEIKYRNNTLSSGVYFYKIHINEFSAIKKMILLQ